MVRVSKNGNEIILYLIFSILITLVNIIGYIICTRSLSLDVYNSNVIAWLLAILFAYLTNRTFVFHSKAKTFKDKLIEAVNFFGSRLFLFVVDMVVMYIMVDLFNISDMVSKVVVNIIVIVLGYVLSKLFIFKK